MKTFYSAQDIEDLAAQGKAELIVDDNIVLTDLARHVAQQLGISMVYKPRTVPTTASPPVSTLAPSASLGLGSKPKGCQHGPLTSQHPGAAVVPSSSNTVV
ncbi:MAG: hypothetical protein P8186_13130, partial [Anaerolineae bacterium]